MFVGSSFNRNCGVIVSRTWVYIFDWFFLTVWYLWLEDGVHSRRVVQLLALFLEIINAWSRIICPGLIIISHIGLLEKFSIHLWLMELILRVQSVIRIGIWMVSSWTNLIKASSSVCSGSHLPCWNTWSYVIRYDSMIVVFIWFIFCKGSI